MALRASHWKLLKSASGFSALLMILICILFKSACFSKNDLLSSITQRYNFVIKILLIMGTYCSWLYAEEVNHLARRLNITQNKAMNANSTIPNPI